MALQDKGMFMQASDLTTLLVKLMYFCHLVTLYESLVYHDSTNMGRTPLGKPLSLVFCHTSLMQACAADMLAASTT
jgi:hypothetical protein